MSRTTVVSLLSEQIELPQELSPCSSYVQIEQPEEALLFNTVNLSSTYISYFSTAGYSFHGALSS